MDKKEDKKRSWRRWPLNNGGKNLYIFNFVLKDNVNEIGALKEHSLYFIYIIIIFLLLLGCFIIFKPTISFHSGSFALLAYNNTTSIFSYFSYILISYYFLTLSFLRSPLKLINNFHRVILCFIFFFLLSWLPACFCVLIHEKNLIRWKVFIMTEVLNRLSLSC